MLVRRSPSGRIEDLASVLNLQDEATIRHNNDLSVEYKSVYHGFYETVADARADNNIPTRHPFIIIGSKLFNWDATSTMVDDGTEDTPSIALTGYAVGRVLRQNPYGGTTANRPSSPSLGQTYYDSDVPGLFVWDGSSWSAV
jgi:hypothetical protein